MDVVSKDHLTGFGAVVHQYAMVEMGLKLALGALMRIDIADIVILCEPYGALDLRNVVKSLAKVRTPMTKPCEQIIQIAGDLGVFSQLRNSIAHNTWGPGEREGAIRPIRLDIRAGKPDPKGMSTGEQDWTVQDLIDSAVKLSALHNRCAQFLLAHNPDAAAMLAKA